MKRDLPVLPGRTVLLLRVATAVLVALVLIGSVGCVSTTFEGKWFSYPPGSVPHPNDPDGRPIGDLIMSCSWSPKAFARPDVNQVEVQVMDRGGKSLLDDTFEATGYDLRADAKWDNRDSIDLVVLAWPKPQSRDITGTPVATRHYVWDQSAGQYSLR